MSITDEVILAVSKAAGVDRRAIRLESGLWRDLHIGGDDMTGLFVHLQKKYQLNLDGLHLPTYSPNEDDVLFQQIADWVRKRLHVDPSDRYKSLTVADLITLVERKMWTHPI